MTYMYMYITYIHFLGGSRFALTREDTQGTASVIEPASRKYCQNVSKQPTTYTYMYKYIKKYSAHVHVHVPCAVDYCKN